MDATKHYIRNQRTTARQAMGARMKSRRWLRSIPPLRAPLACQCDIPGIVQCDLHGPTY